jgi:hypothetical protein
LRLAATYRRFAEYKTQHYYDFSWDMLVECYNRETHGKPASDRNGYLYGKWCRDITVGMWIEDIRRGDFCKWEFITINNRWWLLPIFDTITSTPLFGHVKTITQPIKDN